MFYCGWFMFCFLALCGARESRSFESRFEVRVAFELNSEIPRKFLECHIRLSSWSITVISSKIRPINTQNGLHGFIYSAALPLNTVVVGIKTFYLNST